MSARTLPAWLLLPLAVVVAGCPPAPPDDKDETDTSDTDPPTDDSETETDTDSDTETDTDSDTETETETDLTDDTDTDTDTDIVNTDETDTDTVNTDETDTDTVDTSTVVVPAGLIITEVVDYTTSGMHYVEICNPTANPVSLAGWGLKIYRNSATTPSRVALNTITLAPGDAYVIANSTVPNNQYAAAFGALPDQVSLEVDGNGNDVYALDFGRRNVDVYGVIGQVAAPGTGWYYLDSSANRTDLTTVPRATWLSSEWVLSNNFGTNTSLGRCLETVDTDETETDTDSDTYDPFLGETYETGPVDTGEIIEPYDISDLGVGDLVITEIMADPLSCADGRGQYITFVNGMDRRLLIDGLVLENQAGDTVTLDYEPTVRIGQEVVAWIDPGPPLGHCYFPDGFDVSYETFTLNPAGDVIRIKANGVVIDQVDFRGWASEEGKAWEFSGGFDASLAGAALTNNDESSWCLSSQPIFGATGDYGSPGLGNDACPIVDTDPGTDETDTDTVIDTDTDTDTGPTRTLVTDLSVGDLIITEMLSDPSTPCSNDANGEYIEVYNTTGNSIDLTGLFVESAAGSAEVQAGAHVEPSEAVVLYRTPAGTACFAFATTIAYDAYPYAGNFVFDDVAGDLVRITDGTRVLDTVDFRAWLVKSTRGAAFSLDNGSVDATQNDNESSWCASGFSVGPGNIGTAGAVLACPIDTGTAP